MALKRRNANGELEDVVRESVEAAPEKVQKKSRFRDENGKMKLPFGRKKKKDEEHELKTTDFNAYPHLLAIKPKEKYIFHSDYFEIDNGVATIVAFFHNDGAADNFGPFWGINRIPAGLGDKIVTISFEQINRMSEGWVQDHQTKAEGIAAADEQETQRAGTTTSKQQANRKSYDFEQIAREMQEGAAYLHVNYRLLVKAPTLDDLDYALDQIKRLYMDRFGTLSVAAYAGDQRKELTTLFAKNDKKVGRGFYFTSTEYCGSYSLVTHGLEDPKGEYVGYMVGDVNNSAVLFDTDGYKHHSVIVNENYFEKLGRAHVSDMWCSKLSQAALLNNHRVVHILMNGCNLDMLGPKFESLTSVLDMQHGAVNMFELFGDDGDEMTIFPAQMQKLILMAEQAYATTDSDRSVIRGSLEEVATQFYIDRRMWRANAKEHRDELRIVNIPHAEVPLLQEFVSYLETGYKKQTMTDAKDNEKLHAMSVLRLTFRNLLSNNGDLFNTITSDAIDSAVNGQRVLYDFNGLMRRGKGVAMAQLVNVIGFAVGTLGQGDVIIFHGANLIDNGVKEYIDSQLAHLFSRGGRVIYSYDDTDVMLADKAFCRFDKADFTIFGNLTDTAVVQYQNELGQEIPPDLSRLVTSKSDMVCYIRRGFDNVVFKQDLALGISKKKSSGGKGGMKRNGLVS